MQRFLLANHLHLAIGKKLRRKITYSKNPREQIESISYGLNVVIKLWVLVLESLNLVDCFLSGLEKELKVSWFGTGIHSNEDVLLNIHYFNKSISLQVYKESGLQ